ncbi:MAG: RNA polymerase subunit sigma-70 [Bacteroidales bacterium]|nr:RNA polymerase subunit sigma-70 [Bacteroidales bacterium]
MNKATISADIVSSTELTPSALSQLQKEIKNFVKQLGNKYKGTWGRLSKGDSVEIYIDNPQDSLRIALLLKTLIKKFKVDAESAGLDADKKRLEMFKTYGVRIAIAVGEMRVANKRTNMLDGEAIYASGRAIEHHNTSNKSKIVIKNTLFFESSDAKLSQQINAYLGFLDVLFKRATERQCEVIYYRLLGKTEKEISEQLSVGQSVVNQHSTTFGWNAVEQLLKYYEQMEF